MHKTYGNYLFPVLIYSIRSLLSLYYYYYLLQLSFHSVAVDLTLVTNNNKHTYTKQYKNTVQTIQNTVNTSTHITKTPTQLSKHPYITKPTHTHTHTLQNPHIHTPTHYKNPHLHTHILQNKLKQPQYKIHTI